MKHITIVHGVNKLKGFHHIELHENPETLMAEIADTEHEKIWLHVPAEARFYLYYWLLDYQGSLYTVELA